MIVEHEPGHSPKLVDGGEHTSLFVWVYDNTRTAVSYRVTWRMYHQETLDNWPVIYHMTASGSSGTTPRGPTGQFDITTGEASSLRSAPSSDRRRIFEDLMIKYRKQAFSLLDERHMNEPKFPRIELKQQESTE